VQWHSIPTPQGAFVARYSAQGLVELRFPTAEPSDMPVVVWGWHGTTISAVNAILRGQIPEDMPPLDLTGQTVFRVCVWNELRRIPPGQVATYAEIASRIGDPKAVRAVGGACGANPIPLIIPCHRVVAAGRKLGGFSGGLPWKQKLLAVEGIHFEVHSEQLNFSLSTLPPDR